MAYDAFLKIDGIQGESTDQTHTGWIEVLSFSWGESVATNASRASATGGAGAGKVSFQDIHFSKKTDSASPALFLACASGKLAKTATMSLRKAGGEASSSADFMKWELQNVLVSSYQVGSGLTVNGSYSPLDHGDEDLPTDQFSLNFTKIFFQFTSQRTGGAGDATFDLSAA